MPINMMNESHKSSNKKSRDNHSKIFGVDPRDPTEGIGAKEVWKNIARDIAGEEERAIIYDKCHYREENDQCPTCCEMTCPVAESGDFAERCATCERGRCDGCDIRGWDSCNLDEDEEDR